MTDKQLLEFIHARLVKVHGENPLYDYMFKFKDIIDSIPPDWTTIKKMVIEQRIGSE